MGKGMRMVAVRPPPVNGSALTRLGRLRAILMRLAMPWRQRMTLHASEQLIPFGLELRPRDNVPVA